MIRILTRRLALVTLVSSLVVSSLAIVGCDKDSGAAKAKPAGSTSGSTPQADATARARGNVFSFINRGDIITLDLNQMSYLQDFRVSYALREGLYKPNPSSLDPELCLAKEAKVSDDKKTWTFTLRDDGKWTNGDPVTAKDFVFSWRNLLESPGQYTYLLFYIDGAKAYSDAYRDGTKPSFDSVGIKSPDDHTIEIRLTNPLPYLPDLLTFPTFYPRNEKSMEKFKQVDAKGRVSYDAAYTQAKNVVTNGPFELKDWMPGKQVVMTKSPVYRAKDKIKLDGITMIVNNDPQAAKVMFDAGSVDWLADVSPEIGFNAKQEGRKDLKVSDAFGTCYLTVNCGDDVPELQGKKNPLADVRVRKALAMTIDRQIIINDLTRMGEKGADRFVPAHFYKDWNSKTAPEYDVEGAKKLLAEAGYPNGQGFPPLSICFNADSPARRDISEFLHNQWQKYLNVNIELRAMELKGYRDYVTKKQYTLGMAAWYGDYQDASTWTDKYKSDSENNDSNWAPPKYDELILSATVEPDEGKRKQMLMDAESMINTDLPIIPIYYYVNFVFVRDDVKNLPLNARNTTIWDDVSLERTK
jgi:oligopeptide transport system substrate-binding protein